jgi:hypothetical protein
VKRYLQLKESQKDQLSLHQKIKYSLLTTGFLPLVYSVGAYFLKLGFFRG